jgi:hypothetical protein
MYSKRRHGLAGIASAIMIGSSAGGFARHGTRQSPQDMLYDPPARRLQNTTNIFDNDLLLKDIKKGSRDLSHAAHFLGLIWASALYLDSRLFL